MAQPSNHTLTICNAPALLSATKDHWFETFLGHVIKCPVNWGSSVIYSMYLNGFPLFTITY